MRPLSITLTVLGKPQPAGSKRAFPNPKTGKVIVTDDNAKSRPWKQAVAAEAAIAHTGDVLQGPLGMRLRFFRQRPKGHYGTGRNAAILKDSAPLYPTVKPDATKLTRGVEDALTGVLWRDDAQVIMQDIRDLYGVPERVEIEVWEITPAVIGGAP